MPTVSTLTRKVLQEAPSSTVRFWQGLIQHPQAVASLFPSSTALLRRLQELPGLSTARLVVELGPGTGETTQALLEGMSAASRLLAIDIVPDYIEHLRTVIGDERLLPIEADAGDFDEVLAALYAPAPDLIISGIPFSHLSRDAGSELVKKLHAALAPGGRFVAYQLRGHVRELAEPVFGTPETSFVPFNIPPLTIYQWTKSNGRESVSGGGDGDHAS